MSGDGAAGDRFRTLSLIIPTLGEAILRRTVDHVLAARRPVPVEVVVVGQDPEALVRGDDRVRFVASERKLIPAEARNLGAREATGDLLVFLDSDALVGPEFFEEVVAAMGELREVVHGAMDFVEDNAINIGDNVATFHAMHVSCGAREMDVHVAAFCLAVTRRVFEEMAGFNERIFMAEDWDFGNRLRAANHRIYFEPSVRVVHHSSRETLGGLVRHGQAYAVGFVNMLQQGSDTHTKRRVDWLGYIPPLAAMWSAAQATVHTAKVFLRHQAMRRYLRSAPCVWLFYYARRRHVMRLLCWGDRQRATAR